MNKLTILIGPPGSGKSTHAAAMELAGYLRISQDDMGKQHLDMFHSHITTGRDIVIDRMNFNKQQRDRYRLEAIKNGYTVNFVEFVTPRQVCYDRCMERQGHPTIHGNGAVSEFKGKTYSVETGKIISEKIRKLKAQRTNNALTTFFKNYEEVTEEEGEILRINYNSKEKSSAIMVDIDGTLANLEHRKHYVQGEGKKDWNSFFKHLGEDTVYEDVRGLVETEFESGTNVILCSGRGEEYREATEKWLAKHNIPYTSLKMRPAVNYKADYITKAMLYRYEIKPYYDVKYVVDDRNSVVNKWREMGLTCFQVRVGDF